MFQGNHLPLCPSQDLFPGISITDSVSQELEKAIAEVAAAMRVDLTPAQV